MNILYLAHRLPYPPNKGDKLRAFHQIEYLSRKHNVWCACFVDDPKDDVHIPTLKKYCAQLATIRLRPRLATIRGLAGLAYGKSLTQSYYEHRGMRRVLEGWYKRTSFDAVVAFSSSMAPYALSAPSPRRVLDFCDMDSAKWSQFADQSRSPLRLLYRAEGLRLAKLERKWIDQADATILISQTERKQLSRDIDRRKVHVVGNGVEVSGLHHSPRLSKNNPTRPLVVGFMGVLDYKPNVEGVDWFVKKCWPGIRKEMPKAEFHIVGRSPHRKVNRLARYDGVRVLGEVPDARQVVSAFDVSIAPLQLARGLQNKVLEAMACGKPVVLTHQAADGIHGVSGEHFLVHDHPQKISQAIISLLQQPALRNKIGQQARQYVNVHHQWSTELKKLELIVTGISPEARISPDILSPKSSLPQTHSSH